MPDLFLSSEEVTIECPEIYGISTPQKAYKLAWNIQKSAQFQSRKLDDVEHYYLGGHHCLYEIEDLDNQSRLYLVRNRGEKGFFYPKYKNFDFLLFSVSPYLVIDNDSLTSFKSLNAVSLCLALDEPASKDNMNFVQLL